MKRIAILLAVGLGAISQSCSQSATEWVDRASRQRSGQQLNAALATLTQCLRQNSSYKVCQLERARLYMDLKEYAKAEADLDTLIVFYTEKVKNIPPPEGFMVAVNDNPDRLGLIECYERRADAKAMMGKNLPALRDYELALEESSRLETRELDITMGRATIGVDISNWSSRADLLLRTATAAEEAGQPKKAGRYRAQRAVLLALRKIRSLMFAYPHAILTWKLDDASTQQKLRQFYLSVDSALYFSSQALQADSSLPAAWAMQATLLNLSNNEQGAVNYWKIASLLSSEPEMSRRLAATYCQMRDLKNYQQQVELYMRRAGNDAFEIPCTADEQIRQQIPMYWLHKSDSLLGAARREWNQKKAGLAVYTLSLATRYYQNYEWSMHPKSNASFMDKVTSQTFLLDTARINRRLEMLKMRAEWEAQLGYLHLAEADYTTALDYFSFDIPTRTAILEKRLEIRCRLQHTAGITEDQEKLRELGKIKSCL